MSSRSRKKRGPRFGPIVAAVIVVGGGLGAAAFATGYFDASAPGLAAEPVPTAVATEVSSGVDADVQQPAAPATVVVNSPPTTSGPPAVREAQVLVDVAELEQQMADQVALRDRCRLEHNTVFVSSQAFMNQTGSTPSHPDVLVNSGWLEAHPEGWSSRWQWDISDLGLAVVPVPGTLCDA